MEQIKLTWTETIVDKIHKKHGVTSEEVEEVLYDGKPLFKKGPGSGKNQRYYIFGQTIAGRYLFIVLKKLKGTEFMVITSRNMEEAERKLYKKVK